MANTDEETDTDGYDGGEKKVKKYGEGENLVIGFFW